MAAGINRISVYGVITPTLPVDKRHIAGPTKVHCELLRLLFSCTHKILYRSGYNQTESPLHSHLLHKRSSRDISEQCSAKEYKKNHIISKDNHGTKARPTRQEPLACHAMSNASRSLRRLSSSLSASCRLLAAAPAPGPSWDSLLSRQRAFARTMVMLIARRISPVTLPSCPGPASHPWALDSAKASRSLWKSGERVNMINCTSYVQFLPT